MFRFLIPHRGAPRLDGKSCLSQQHLNAMRPADLKRRL